MPAHYTQRFVFTDERKQNNIPLVAGIWSSTVEGAVPSTSFVVLTDVWYHGGTLINIVFIIKIVKINNGLAGCRYRP